MVEEGKENATIRYLSSIISSRYYDFNIVKVTMLSVHTVREKRKTARDWFVKEGMTGQWAGHFIVITETNQYI